MSSLPPKVFLIYIPCHSDYERAMETAARIRTQFDAIQDSKIKKEFVLKIYISVNGINLSPEKYHELAEFADLINYFTEPLRADININQGFLKALEIKPNYFWILSANEYLVDGSINFILNSIVSNYESDLFVTNSLNRSTTYSTSNVFIDIPSGSGYGLISSVIYNFEKTRGAFSAGPRFAWTGWGQLAVLQTACEILGSLQVTEFPDLHVYRKPFTDVEPGSEISEFEFVRSAYAHSYFGMPILIFALFCRERSIRNRVLFSWLKKNWFKIRYFKKGSRGKRDSMYPQFDPQWTQQIANLILITSGILVFVPYLVGSILNFETSRQNPFFIFAKRNFVRK